MRRALATLFVLGIVALAGCLGGAAQQQPAVDAASGHDTGGTGAISVSASGGVQSNPEQAVVRLGIETTSPNASTARQQLANRVERLRGALERMGLDSDQIRTERYDLDQDYRRPPREDEEPEPRYRATQQFRITVEELDRAGPVIDTAVQNGANQVHGVEFTVSGERRTELREQALRGAMANARNEAEILAEESNLTITGVHTVRTAEVSYGGPERALAEATPTAAGDAGTNIDSGPITVSAQVNVVYNVSRT
jgi:uncharacterized protein YggE